MGYCLSVFAIGRPYLEEGPLAHDMIDYEWVAGEMEDDLRDYDEQMIDAADEDGDFTHAKALAEIYGGRFSRPHLYSRYGWAFDVFCAFRGEMQNNTHFAPCRIDWYDELAASDAPVRFSQLINDPPIALPSQDDWPCIGHWSESQIAAAVKFWPALLEAQPPGDIRDALVTAHGWLTTAADAQNEILVGVHG